MTRLSFRFAGGLPNSGLDPTARGIVKRRGSVRGR